MFEDAVVAIEAPGSPDYLAAAVGGCSSALGPGRCIDAATTTEQTEWHAVVRTATSSNPRVIVIEVWRNGVLFKSRILHLSDRDAADTRWTTAGVVVAAIVSGGVDRTDSEGEPSASPAEPARDEPTPSVEAPVDPIDPIDPIDPVDPIDGVSGGGRPWYELRGSAVELLVGGGVLEVYQGPPEFGALLRGKLKLAGGFQVSAGVAQATVPANPLILQVDGFVGLGVPIALSRDSALDLGASFMSEWLWLQHEADSGRVDSAQAWRFGAAVDVDFRVRVVGRWAAVAGARATFLRPEVDIRRPIRPDGPSRQLSIVLPAGFGLGLGVRYDFNDAW